MDVRNCKKNNVLKYLVEFYFKIKKLIYLLKVNWLNSDLKNCKIRGFKRFLMPTEILLNLSPKFVQNYGLNRLSCIDLPASTRMAIINTRIIHPPAGPGASTPGPTTILII